MINCSSIYINFLDEETDWERLENLLKYIMIRWSKGVNYHILIPNPILFHCYSSHFLLIEEFEANSIRIDSDKKVVMKLAFSSWAHF